MILSGFPNLSVIKAMRGHVDFYMLNGQAIARRWPRIRMRPPTPAQLWNRKVPSIANKLRARLPVYWWNAWNSMGTPTGRTSWDIFTNVFFWLANHRYVFPTSSPFADELEVPMMPMACEVIPLGGQTLVYIYLILEPPFAIERVDLHLVPSLDERPLNFSYVYVASYSPAPSKRPPPYAWSFPRTVDPTLFGLNILLWRLELFYPGDFSQCNFWTTYRFIPPESPIRTNPPTNPVWYSGHLPDTPPAGWPPVTEPWPWQPWWPPYYATL